MTTEGKQINLSTALTIDIISAVSAACCVAPGIKIVDQVVTEKTADNSRSIFKSALENVLSLVKKPKVFLTKPTFLFVCLVYSGTYITANSVLSICEYMKQDPTYMKLACTTGVNMTLGILKDRYFAQVFSGRPPEKFPLASWLLFIGRDLATIAAGFTLPAYVSQKLQETQMISNKNVADIVSQIGVPITAQFILTPIHLLALDFYMQKISLMSGRIGRVMHNVPEATTIRMGRVLFAYGIAGVCNIGLRKKLREMYL